MPAPVGGADVEVGGGALLPDLFNRMQVGGVVHSIERTYIRFQDTTWSPAPSAIAQGWAIKITESLVPPG
jgi:hypothetical protein